MDIDCGFSKYDYLSLPELNSCEESKHISFYNSLPSIEEADSIFKRKDGFDDFLEEAGNLAHKYDLAEVMGLGLLHKHFDLESGQVMFENYINRSLVTSAHNISALQHQNALPYGWIFSNSGSMEVFEFSTDPVVQSTVKQIKDSKFLQEMHNLFVEHQMQDLFALSILNKELLEHKAGYIYQEMNYGDAKHSVVQLVEANLTNNADIITSWSFSDVIQHRCVIWHKCVKLFGSHVQVGLSHGYGY